MWKQHFKNFLGKPPKVTDGPITKIISNQLDIKLGQFTPEELGLVLRKIINRKAAGLDEITPEVWKRHNDDKLLRYCNAVYNQNTIDKTEKGLYFPFSQEGWPQNNQELPRYKPYIHSSQDLQCPATQLHRTYYGLCVWHSASGKYTA